MRLARAAGWLAHKIDHQTHWPDYLFLTGSKRFPVVFVEFKRPGEKPRPHQAEMIAALRKERHVIALSINSVSSFRTFLKNF